MQTLRPLFILGICSSGGSRSGGELTNTLSPESLRVKLLLCLPGVALLGVRGKMHVGESQEFLLKELNFPLPIILGEAHFKIRHVHYGGGLKVQVRPVCHR